MVEKAHALHLQELQQTPHDFYFRYWRNGQIAETWRTGTNTYTGQIIHFTEKVVPPDKKTGEEKTRQLISETIPLDTAAARLLAKWASHIATIPPRCEIAGWQNCIDGTSYSFETSRPGSWTFASYVCPEWQQKELPEAARLIAYIDSIHKTLHFQDYRDRFYETLPAGTYTSDSWVFLTKSSPASEARLKKWQPNIHYHNAIRDTLNSYLAAELTRVLKQRDDSLPAFRSYAVRFSRHNRVTRITSIEPFRGVSRKPELWREKRIIRKALRRIPLDFVHSPRRYAKEIAVTNTTIYVF